MGIVIPEGSANIAHFWTLSGDVEPMAITYGLRSTLGGLTADEYADIAALGIDASGYDDAANMVTGWNYAGLRCTLQDASGPIVVERPASVTGVASGTTLPQNCALLMQKRSASGGRRNRGRMYLPPAFVVEGVVSATGTLLTVDVNALNARNSAWLGEIESNDANMVIFHSEAPFLGTVVTALLAQSVIATQRRRLR